MRMRTLPFDAPLLLQPEFFREYPPDDFGPGWKILCGTTPVVDGLRELRWQLEHDCD